MNYDYATLLKKIKHLFPKVEWTDHWENYSHYGYEADLPLGYTVCVCGREDYWTVKVVFTHLEINGQPASTAFEITTTDGDIEFLLEEFSDWIKKQIEGLRSFRLP